ncbi:MAG TPA: hypothetical protein VIL57_04200 [Bacteroidia bacterium]
MENLNTQEKKKSNKGLIIVLILLLLGSIAANVYQFFNTKEVIVEREKIADQVDTLVARKAELETEVNKITEELNQFQGKNAELDSLLAEANEKIEAQKRQIAGLIDSKQDHQILQARYDELRKLKDEYLRQIDQLLAENKELRYQNTELSVKVDKLNEKNNELASKVEIASALKIQNIKLTPYKVKANGKQVEVEKASKADRINVRFNVIPNKLSAEGEKIAYLRIMNPQGYVVADINQSNRHFLTRDGKELPYSRLVKFEYNGDATMAEVNWEQEIFTKGVYKFEIYIDGDYAGGNEITLD